MGRCKITVIKTLYYPELAAQYPPYEKNSCESLREGDIFYTEGPYGVDIPKGFCPAAWRAIFSFACDYASGGKVYGFDRHLVSCPDGVRPVLLQLEQADD